MITSSSSLVTSLFFLLLAAPFPLHVPHYPFIFPLSSTLMACQCRFLPDKEPCLLGSFSRFHVVLLCHCDLNILLQRNVVGVQLYAQFRSTSNPWLYMKQPFSVTFAFPTAPPPPPHFSIPATLQPHQLPQISVQCQPNYGAPQQSLALLPPTPHGSCSPGLVMHRLPVRCHDTGKGGRTVYSVSTPRPLSSPFETH